MAKHDELLRLIKENPDLEIVPMVDSEICGDDYSCYLGEWGKCFLAEYFCTEERIWFKSEDYETLKEELIDDKYDTDWKGKTDEELEELAEQIVSGYNWVKCIAVNIEAP